MPRSGSPWLLRLVGAVALVLGLGVLVLCLERLRLGRRGATEQDAPDQSVLAPRSERPAPSEEKPKEQPPRLTPDLDLVDKSGLCFLSVRLADLTDGNGAHMPDNVKKSFRFLTSVTRDFPALAPSNVERLSFLAATDSKFRRDREVEPWFLVVRTVKPTDLKEALARMRPEQHGGRTIHAAGTGLSVCVIDERTVLLGAGAVNLKALLDRIDDPKTPRPLSEVVALAEAGRHVVAGLAWPDLLRVFDLAWTRGLRDLPPELLPYKPLLLARTAGLTLQFGPETQLDFLARFDDEETAINAENSLGTLLYVAREKLPQLAEDVDISEKETPALAALVAEARRSMRNPTIQRNGKLLSGFLKMKTDPAALPAVFKDLEKATQRTRSANNLHQLGVALHSFHDANGQLPAAYSTDGQGKPLLSWRVAILPYIEQGELYKQFHLDEPWDSEHNVKLLDKMPEVYAPVRPTKEKNVTYYRVFVGWSTALPPGRMRWQGGVHITQITDGTSNTLMVVEGAEAVPWTRPDEIPFDVDKMWPQFGEVKEVPKLGGQFPDGFHAVMCDGSVYFFRKETPPRVLAPLIVRNDGSVVAFYEFTRRRPR
jgi:hypothetical protein